MLSYYPFRSSECGYSYSLSYITMAVAFSNNSGSGACSRRQNFGAKEFRAAPVGVCDAQKHEPLSEVLAETQDGNNRARLGLGRNTSSCKGRSYPGCTAQTSPQSIRNDHRQPPCLNVSCEMLKALNGGPLKKYTSHPCARARRPQRCQGKVPVRSSRAASWLKPRCASDRTKSPER
jgi:hypothetical protein